MLTRKLGSWCIVNQMGRKMCTEKPSIKKSFEKYDPILAYCQSMSTALHPALKELQRETLTLGNSVMMGAPEVISMNMFLIKAIQAKKVLDVGVFTGSSSLAAALAVGEGGTVFALEKSKKHNEMARLVIAVFLYKVT